MSTVRSASALEHTFAVYDLQGRATPIEHTADFWQVLQHRYGDFAGRTLVSSFAFDRDWPNWEIHPHGDELVCALRGDFDLVLDEPQGLRRVRLAQPAARRLCYRAARHLAHSTGTRTERGAVHHPWAGHDEPRGRAVGRCRPRRRSGIAARCRGWRATVWSAWDCRDSSMPIRRSPICLRPRLWEPMLPCSVDHGLEFGTAVGAGDLRRGDQRVRGPMSVGPLQE